ncbi:MAG: tetratricopeptide repeat protein [Alphaproteobacteria bacterium]|nr:tetratricopeptide repeat protein [Alphaproteobacteria bacterium]
MNRRILFTFALLVIGVAWAATSPQAMSKKKSGSESAETEAPSAYAAGEKAIKAKDWDQAIAHLTKAVASNPEDADAENLLGYSYRKVGKLDLALEHYGRALTLNPKHKGAHEYIGETYLELGDVVKAEEHLGKLDRICTFGCEEYDELKAAIKAFKSKGSS